MKLGRGTEILLQILTLFFFILVGQSLVAQKKYTVSGSIKDARNGETLQGAYIMLQDTAKKGEVKGAISNQAGFFSVTADAGIYILKVSYLSYKEILDTIDLNTNRTFKFEMEPAVIRSEAVVVSAKRDDQNVTAVDVGKMEMKIETIKSMPAMFGEVDVLKSIQLLPGVQSSGEGSSGFYVRGGAADQNLILLDEATIYNAGHLFGFFSIFNADAVKSVEITKSGMPAYYGGRLASILDVYQKEGNMKKYEVEGGLGLIFSRLTVQGPIKKDRASFIFSGRRTYVDILAQPFIPKTSPLKGTRFYFYDLNGKVNVIINDKHRLYLGGYYGSDLYGFNSQSGVTTSAFSWGNAAASLRWNYVINPQLFLNTSLVFSDYRFKTDMKQDVYKFNINSGVRDYAAKTELTYLPAIPHTFKFGIHYIFHTFTPNTYHVDAGEDNSMSIKNTKPYYAHDLAIYVNDEFDIDDGIRLNLGLRYTHFEHIGPFTRFILDDMGNIEDSIVYSPGQRVKQYNYLEPRVSLRFLIDSSTSIKASYTLNYQYIHQVSLSSISLPTDVWMPSTDIIKPQVGTQYSIGLYRNFHKNMFETSIDFYYKNLKNLIEYKEGIDMLSQVSLNPDQTYTFGSGYSYGMEVFLKKAKGRFSGFIGYTLSYTKRKFENLNKGNPFYAKYDRRHDVSISLNYEILRDKLSVAAVWVYATGNTMVIPLGYYFFDGTMITEYSDRDAFRVPPYHRLDVSLNWTIVKKKRFESSLNFSVYNVYNRMNPFFVFFETTTNFTPTEFEIDTKAYQMSLFPVIPSISWNFKF